MLLAVASAFIVGASGASSLSSAGAHAASGDNNTTVGPNYTVTFHELGLPNGTNWSVVVCITWSCWDDDGSQFGTSNTSTITFSLPNGTYNYHVFPYQDNWSTPSRGTVTVNGSAPAPVVVNFGPPTTYTITFTERGLVAGTEWSVALRPADNGTGCIGWDLECGDQGGGGSSDVHAAVAAPADGDHHGWGWGHWYNSSNTSSITFQVTNGSFNYTVFSVTGYSVMGADNGSVNVSGAAPAPIGVTFSALPTYAVTFQETGLPNGTNWSVAVFGSGEFGDQGARGGHSDAGVRTTQEHHHYHFGGTASAPSSIVINVTNGTYHYFADWVWGYYSNESFGSFSVNGSSPATITIAFQPVPTYNVTFNESGLPNGTDWGLTVMGSGGHYLKVPMAHIHVSHAAVGLVTFHLPVGKYHVKLVKLVGYKAKGHFPGQHFRVATGALSYQVTFVAAHGPSSRAQPAAPASHASTAAAMLATLRELPTALLNKLGW